MNNFDFNIPTDIRFGKGKIACLEAELSKYGKRVLLTYGGGSIKKNGIYAEVLNQLTDFQVFELGGITPNPKLSIVEKGTDICKKNNIDVILAVGGGSTIDASKHIAAADLCLAGHFSGNIMKAKRTIPGKAYIYEAMEKPMILGDGMANHELFNADEKHIFVEMGNPKALAGAIRDYFEYE